MKIDKTKIDKTNLLTIQTYDVWIQGYNYRKTKESAPARCLGIVEADNFKEAVIKVCTQNNMMDAHLNLDNLSYKFCKFFDNEKDAKKMIHRRT